MMTSLLPFRFNLSLGWDGVVVMYIGSSFSSEDISKTVVFKDFEMFA